MSKASEWASRRQAVESTRPQHMEVVPCHGSPLGAGVSDKGEATVTYGTHTMWLTPEAAVKLGQWLLHTFGEEPF